MHSWCIWSNYIECDLLWADLFKPSIYLQVQAFIAVSIHLYYICPSICSYWNSNHLYIERKNKPNIFIIRLRVCVCKIWAFMHVLVMKIRHPTRIRNINMPSRAWNPNADPCLWGLHLQNRMLTHATRQSFHHILTYYFEGFNMLLIVTRGVSQQILKNQENKDALSRSKKQSCEYQRSRMQASHEQSKSSGCPTKAGPKRSDLSKWNFKNWQICAFIAGHAKSWFSSQQIIGIVCNLTAKACNKLQ